MWILVSEGGSASVCVGGHMAAELVVLSLGSLSLFTRSSSDRSRSKAGTIGSYNTRKCRRGTQVGGFMCKLNSHNECLSRNQRRAKDLGEIYVDFCLNSGKDTKGKHAQNSWPQHRRYPCLKHNTNSLLSMTLNSL